MEKLIETIQQIADQNPNGFTYDIQAGALLPVPGKGFSVAMKESQNSFGTEGLRKCVSLAVRTTNLVGGWKEGGKFYFDVPMIFEDREDAIKAGIENEQIAIFDFETGLPIYL